MTTISSPIPTNIITGFLGSGKTTLIQHLLSQKPEDERWAILVNEFGEIGIDGQLLEKAPENNQEIYIREVPGGCMCCTSGLPMQIALNQLITKANPHRLIIEPTGLGHPKEVLAELKAEHNSPYIDLKTVVTLIDARKLVQPKYHSHKIYSEQMEVADLIVANKSDLYEENDIALMGQQLQSLGLDKKPIQLTSMGQLDIELLENPAGNFADLPHFHAHSHSHHHHEEEHNHGHHHDHEHEHEHEHEHNHQSLTWQEQLEQKGFANVKLAAEKSKDGFYTEGWIFNREHVFDFDKIYDFLKEVSAERVKGVFITNQGIFGFNKVDDVLSYSELDESSDTRVEFIFEKNEENGVQDKISEPEINIETILRQALQKSAD